VLPAAREAFYESGCQGRTPPALAVVDFDPWQPAPLFAWARPLGFLGFAGQSSSASFSSIQAPDPLGDVCKRAGRAGRTWSYPD